MDEPTDAEVLAQPPAGAWLHDGPDGIAIGASMRGPLANVFVPFTIIYMIAAPAILRGIGAWQGFDPMILFALVSAILCDIPLVAVCLLCTIGKQEVRLRGAGAHVFTGVGNLGWTRAFDPVSIVEVREVMSGIAVNRVPLPAIEIVDGESLKFGAYLSPVRRRFILAALRHWIAGAAA